MSVLDDFDALRAQHGDDVRAGIAAAKSAKGAYDEATGPDTAGQVSFSYDGVRIPLGPALDVDAAAAVWPGIWAEYAPAGTPRPPVARVPMLAAAALDAGGIAAVDRGPLQTLAGYRDHRHQYHPPRYSAGGLRVAARVLGAVWAGYQSADGGTAAARAAYATAGARAAKAAGELLDAARIAASAASMPALDDDTARTMARAIGAAARRLGVVLVLGTRPVLGDDDQEHRPASAALADLFPEAEEWWHRDDASSGVVVLAASGTPAASAKAATPPTSRANTGPDQETPSTPTGTPARGWKLAALAAAALAALRWIA